MKIYTKDSLISELKKIRNTGWIKSSRQGNVGDVGNTIEDLLGITENNLPLPNAGEWELKCQRKKTTSLITLFHMEPSPRAFKFVPQILLLKYGWPHKEAGKKHPTSEKSFRQTINGLAMSDRGFKVIVDQKNNKILISFDSKAVDKKHRDWLTSVKKRIGLGELNPQPYWGFNDLFYKAGSKLTNCFYIMADTKKINNKLFFRYTKIQMLQNFDSSNFISAINAGNIYVDFDARTGHNHGTKFRIKQNILPSLYSKVTDI
jgi:hypothetical protein